jgi:hypothetical protein
MSIQYRPNNTFIFSFVRMNPPTPGHLVLIKNLIDKAIELGSEKAYIITSSSVDGKNPMPCSADTIPKPKNKADGVIMDSITNSSSSLYKERALNEMIAAYKRELISKEVERTSSSASAAPLQVRGPQATATQTTASKKSCIGSNCVIVGGGRREQIENLQVIVLCSTGSPFSFINSIIRRDFIDRGVPKINMYFIVGRDRADFLDTIVDTFKKYDYISSIDGLILGREGMTALKASGLGDRSIADIDPSAYSASFIRGLVKNGQREEFRQVYEKYLPAEDINKMFETIRIGITMKPPASKDEDENPESRYFDRGLLPVIVTSGGRKAFKRRSKVFGKTNKKRKTLKRKKTKRR